MKGTALVNASLETGKSTNSAGGAKRHAAGSGSYMYKYY